MILFLNHLTKTLRPLIVAPSFDAELFGELIEISANKPEQLEADIDEEEAKQANISGAVQGRKEGVGRTLTSNLLAVDDGVGRSY